MRALIFAAAVFVAAPALSQTPATSLTLVNTSPAARVIVDGAIWNCEGTSCSATGGTSQPAPRACRRVVARVGQVSAFSYKGVALNADQLAACNAA